MAEAVSLRVVQYCWRRSNYDPLGTGHLELDKYNVLSITRDKTVIQLKRRVLALKPKSDAVFMEIFIHRPSGWTRSDGPMCHDPDDCFCCLFGPLDNHAKLWQYGVRSGDVLQLWPQWHYRNRPWPFQ